MRSGRLMVRGTAFGAALLVALVGWTSMSGAFAVIHGVSFSGPAASATVTVTGSSFGTAPKGTPDTACGPSTGVGDTYGANLFFVDNTHNWEAGYKGTTDYNCLGIIIQSWSTTKAVLKFGKGFGTGGWIMHNGDHFAVALNGWMYGGTVSGLS